MKVSVIIPVYNAESYIAQTLDSVLSQQFDGELEVIAVNDGSPDGSANILEDYRQRDNRLRIIHKENEGQSAARNTGLDFSTGNYITFVDADDILLPGAIGLLLTAVVQTDSPMACGGIKTSRRLPSAQPAPGKDEKIECIDAKTAIGQTLYRTKLPWGGSVWGKIFARNLFDDIRFVKGLYYEDLEIMPRLMYKAEKIACVDSPVYFYRQVGDSFIHHWTPRRQHVLTAIEILSEQPFIKEDSGLKRAVENREFCAASNLLLLAQHAPGDETQLIDRCYSIIKERRRSVIFDIRSRWKARLGAILSFFGKQLFVSVNNIFRVVN